MGRKKYTREFKCDSAALVLAQRQILTVLAIQECRSVC